VHVFHAGKDTLRQHIHAREGKEILMSATITARVMPMLWFDT
jgi:guanylate kinase